MSEERTTIQAKAVARKRKSEFSQSIQTHRTLWKASIGIHEILTRVELFSHFLIGEQKWI